eukprot:2877977-Pyramimonas_sp.AAC.1
MAIGRPPDSHPMVIGLLSEGHRMPLSRGGRSPRRCPPALARPMSTGATSTHRQPRSAPRVPGGRLARLNPPRSTCIPTRRR